MSDDRYVPLSVRYGNRRTRAHWWWGTVKERFALWLCPWLGGYRSIIAPVEQGGDRLYKLLAYFDSRDGSPMAHLVRSAREGWERSSADMAEAGAWHEFDARWASHSPKDALDLAHEMEAPDR